ncbi:hypothetical protein, partial [Pseudomonas sp. SIMBA_044]|uniref:hypothetical protein n=1 Tax=Pseudomonas sp. SIMBA_044 TaxID=3085785 RepID=UPI00397818F0
PLVCLAAEVAHKRVHRKWPHLYDGYGRKRLDVLGRELEKNRLLGEEREREHQLEMQKLVETFPMFAEVDEHSQEELLL